MARIIDPPRAQFKELPTPLTDGERQVIDLFDRKLPAEWEIYVQPHLNGLRPDIVLLHPQVGVAVFEVKDWDLRAMRYYAREDGSGSCTLWALDQNGKHFSRERDNPINKLLLYKRELFDLYCPRLDGRAGLAAISAGLVFPCSTRVEVERVFRPFIRAHEGMRKHPIYHPVSGADDLASGDIGGIFPESGRTSSAVMNSEIANDLRGWLREPFFSREQRQHPKLNSRQRLFVEQAPTTTGYRRIRGPAGSGKSVALAGRASWLAAEGRNVLVVCFNITLLNYLRDLTVRYATPRSIIRRQVDFLSFHHWCKRICLSTGNKESYDELWAEAAVGDDLDPDPVLRDGLASLVMRFYQEDAGGSMPKYDAILVDEGQDFRLSWWQALRCALKPSGEMVLAVDKTQDVYGTAAAWTDVAMKGAGFSGRWGELKISYRLPPRVVAVVQSFAEQFLIGHQIDLPEVERTEQMEMFPVELRWVHVRQPSDVLAACDSELRRMMTRLREDTAIPDIIFLSDSAALGREFIERQAGRNLYVRHTFAEDRRESRRQKRAFFKGGEGIKATTPHSFKGWEARHLIVYVGSVKGPRDRALLYTALTRLRRHEQGSCLTVVSCCDELRAFGKSWPEYQEF